MKLRHWLTSKNMTNAEFAALISVDESSVSRYVNGRLPRKVILARVVEHTDGQVTANDFFTPDEDDDDVNERAPAVSNAA